MQSDGSKLLQKVEHENSMTYMDYEYVENPPTRIFFSCVITYVPYDSRIYEK